MPLLLHRRTSAWGWGVLPAPEGEGSELLRPLPLAHRWRTKQNLDYCFLMMYAQSKGIYYVQVSTDTLLCPLTQILALPGGCMSPCAVPVLSPLCPSLCSWRTT